MARIVDYASLAQSISDFSHRQDMQTGLYTDYFIQGAQEKIQDDIFEANFGNGIRYQEVPFPPTNIGSTGTLPVPSDWLTPKSMQIADGSGNIFTLIFKAVAWIYDAYPIRQPSGLPAYIARDNEVGGEVFIFGPYPDSSYSVQGTYYQVAPQLSNSITTNWMVTYAPTMLHAACMIKAGEFLVDDTMIARWTPTYQSRLDAMILKDKSERWAASTMQIETG
jgi:hypothetical protein